MEAVTIRPEWAWAIRYAGCRVIGKDFYPEGLEGRRIALSVGGHVGGHAGKPSAFAGLQEVAHAADLYRVQMHLVPFWDHEQEPCLAVRRAFDAAGTVIRAADLLTNVVFGTAEIARPLSFREFAWAVPGRHHWFLRDVRFLVAPVECPGKPGVWPVAEHVVGQVMQQSTLDAAREAIRESEVQP